IDFTPTDDIANCIMRIEIDKSLTIKSGYNYRKAVLKNGSLILEGGKTSDNRSTFIIENIVFDGLINTNQLKYSDFDYPWSEEEQEYILDEPEMAQYALSFKGNVDAKFVGCDFQNYMHEYGPILHIRYGDYTSIPSLMEMFGDYSGCSLNISFDKCNIANNAALYDGGALFIEANKNVALSMTNCVIKDNYSGECEFSIGGGAIYASGTSLSIENSRIENNSANHVFSDRDLPDEDKIQGGGIYAEGSKLSIVNCYIVGNEASMGGGLSLVNVDGIIDGCVLANNRAEEHSTNWTGDVGPWNNMAQGGAIYHSGLTGSKVLVLNSSIYNNSAQNAYGGIYSHYSGVFVDIAAGELELEFCAYYNNTCDSTYDYHDEKMILWASHPGDIMEIPYIKATCSIIIDDTFSDVFPRYEKPALDNKYNYVASNGKLNSDNITINYNGVSGQIVACGEFDFSIPSDYSDSLIGNRYSGKLNNPHIGSNYDISLYKEIENDSLNTSFALYYIILAIIVVIILVAVLITRKKEQSNNDKTLESIVDKTNAPIIVNAWFTKEDIDTIMTTLTRVQTLTGRETEVLVEMLEGKKQKEIAYDLGIEITTVKDFYRKIYDKLGFSNKEELFKRCSGIVSSNK
ncbi:MAG: LuxR C-terminal-related transcriptional regulator, partial [Clostridia bacterium]|nr:LuxR C-terminal-related transcriptional regulator [Clostridia bacterium]